MICDFVFCCLLVGRCEVCHDDEQHTSARMHDDCGRLTHMWNIVVDFIVLLCGAGSFHDLSCAPHPSHIAGNRIGDAGCIELSSCLVHLSHLKALRLYGKFV